MARRAASRNLRLRNVLLQCFQRAAQTVLGVYLKRTCSRVTSASSTIGILNDYALYKSTHSLTHSLVWLGAPAQHTGIHTASKAGCGSKHAINHAAVSYLTAINAHVQTQPVIGHLPQTPAPSPENNPRRHRVGTAGRCPQL